MAGETDCRVPCGVCNDRISISFFRLSYLSAHTVFLYSKGFQREVCPFGHSGRSGNPIERVSGGSFPYFCPHRNRVPARHERKKTLFLKKEKRIAAHLTVLAMTGKRKYICAPYGVCNDKEVKKLPHTERRAVILFFAPKRL